MFFVSLIEFFETLILGRKAAFASDVDDQKNLAFKGLKRGFFAFDCFHFERINRIRVFHGDLIADPNYPDYKE